MTLCTRWLLCGTVIMTYAETSSCWFLPKIKLVQLTWNRLSFNLTKWWKFWWYNTLWLKLCQIWIISILLFMNNSSTKLENCRHTSICHVTEIGLYNVYNLFTELYINKLPKYFRSIQYKNTSAMISYSNQLQKYYIHINMSHWIDKKSYRILNWITTCKIHLYNAKVH